MLPEDKTGDWWSEILQELSTEDPCASELVIVAEIGNRWNARSSRQLYTALIAPDQVTAALTHPGGIGYRIDTSGPHPSPVLSEPERKYRPKCWIWAGEVAPDGLEPLVVAWMSGNQTTLVPDQGVLMTYALVPRSVDHRDTFEIHWDDPATPRRDVVIVQPVSISNYPEVTSAFVTIHRDYLRDYATLRGCSLIHVYFAEKWGALTEQVAKILGDKRGCAFDYPGGHIVLHRVSGIEPEVVAKVWGVRHLCDPGNLPVSGGRWDYGSLLWPGMPWTSHSRSSHTYGADRGLCD
jgi:hypothetical protein